MKINIRPATEEDIDFLIDSIIESEKSGTDKISYCTIFNLTELELRPLLSQMLSEDLQGQELCFSDFLIAETELGERAGTCAAWIEGLQDITSKQLKANLLAYFIPKEKLHYAAQHQDMIASVGLDRTQGTMQIETNYTIPKFRGQGINGMLIKAQAKRYANKTHKAQLIIAHTNQSAYNAYYKIGFRTITQKQSSFPQIINFLPSNTRVLMECSITELI